MLISFSSPIENSCGEQSAKLRTLENTKWQLGACDVSLQADHTCIAASRAIHWAYLWCPRECRRRYLGRHTTIRPRLDCCSCKQTKSQLNRCRSRTLCSQGHRDSHAKDVSQQRPDQWVQQRCTLRGSTLSHLDEQWLRKLNDGGSAQNNWIGEKQL